jgi:nucleoside-diphosphate-sugar epimerase
MKILITGATGKIGTRLIDVLSSDFKIIGLDRILHVDDASAKFYQVDLTKYNEVEPVFETETPECVIHLAAILGSVCESEPELAKQINVDVTENLVKLAIKYKVKKFIFASSSAIYEQKVLLPTKEEQNINPRSVYGKTKLAAEGMMLKLSNSTEMKFIILRIFNIFGEEFSDSLVNKLIGSTNVLPVVVLGPDNFVRDYVHISDVARAFELAVKTEFTSQTAVVNIASGIPTSNSKLIEIIRRKNPNMNFSIKSCEDNFSWADIRRAEKLLRFKPEVDISKI